VAGDGEKASVLRIGITQVKLGEYVEADDLLRRSALFKKISDTERQVLLRNSKSRALKPGEILLQEALPAKSLYFLLDGVVRLSVQAGITELVSLTKGDVFGLSAIDPSAIRPQAKADGDARVALLPADQVQVLMQTTPSLGDYLRELADERRKLAADGASFFDRW
jgi:signal-transduction protein with cAMP-binding, CBS, and nucleotidyltransferase domain